MVPAAPLEGAESQSPQFFCVPFVDKERLETIRAGLQKMGITGGDIVKSEAGYTFAGESIPDQAQWRLEFVAPPAASILEIVEYIETEIQRGDDGWKTPWIRWMDCGTNAKARQYMDEGWAAATAEVRCLRRTKSRLQLAMAALLAGVVAIGAVLTEYVIVAQRNRAAMQRIEALQQEVQDEVTAIDFRLNNQQIPLTEHELEEGGRSYKETWRILTNVRAAQHEVKKILKQ